jgi:DNA-directed RNA polymerase subunit RPC12/RpoP
MKIEILYCFKCDKETECEVIPDEDIPDYPDYKCTECGDYWA